MVWMLVFVRSLTYTDIFSSSVFFGMLNVRRIFINTVYFIKKKNTIFKLQLQMYIVWVISQVFFLNIKVRVSSFRLRRPTLDLMRLTISYTTKKTIILCKPYGMATEIRNTNWLRILLWFITSCRNIFIPALSCSIRREIFFFSRLEYRQWTCQYEESNLILVTILLVLIIIQHLTKL